LTSLLLFASGGLLGAVAVADPADANPSGPATGLSSNANQGVDTVKAYPLDIAIMAINVELASARDSAQSALTNARPVSHESAVATAIAGLHAVQSDASATVAQLQSATSSLDDAVLTAKQARDAANTAATDLIASAQASTAAGYPSVIDTIKNLQLIQAAAAVDSPTDLTASIAAATQALTDALAQQAAAREQAISGANAALTRTSPVSHEPGVVPAISNLQSVLADSKSSAAAITAATDVLKGEVASEEVNRQSAVYAAQIATSSAAQLEEDLANTDLQKQVQDLKDMLDRAAADSASDLTQQIIEATNTINFISKATDNVKVAAIRAANDAVLETRPVTNEPTVRKAIDDVNVLLQAQDSTSEQISAATTALTTAISQAKAERVVADQAAADAINNSATADGHGDIAVQVAVNVLRLARATAAADAADALSKDLDFRVAALKSAQALAVETAGEAAKQAQVAIADTAPVSNQPSVLALKQQLQAQIEAADATSTRIETASNALLAAAANAKQDRNDAITAANRAKSAAAGSSVASDPSVVAALSQLTDTIDRSKTDAANALTADILLAMDQLILAVDGAGQTTPTDPDAARQEAIAAANAALADLSPVSHESAVASAASNLSTLVADATATTAAIQAATSALTDASSAAKTARTAAVNDGQAVATAAKASAVGADSSVLAAVKAFDDLVASAGADSANATTANIQSAAQVITAAVESAQAAAADRAAAKNAGQVAIDDAKAAIDDPAVTSAIDQLTALMNDPTSATADIAAATTALGQLVRSKVVGAAQAMIDQAKASPAAGEPEVTQAVSALTGLLAKEDATLAQLTSATEALRAAVATSEAELSSDAAARAAAVTAANNAISQAESVKSVAAVAAAITSLQQAISDPDSTADDLTALTAALNQAVATANASPSESPSGSPSSTPSSTPSGSPSSTASPTESGSPSASPSGSPSASPSGTPSGSPSSIPSGSPSATPSGSNTANPTPGPSQSASPTAQPTNTSAASSSSAASGSGKSSSVASTPVKSSTVKTAGPKVQTGAVLDQGNHQALGLTALLTALAGGAAVFGITRSQIRQVKERSL
jgi:hypothetical protein